MISDEYADRVAEVACQATDRVRERDPQAFDQWLRSTVPTGVEPALWYRQLVAMSSAAVPQDVPWSVLTGWVSRIDEPYGRTRLRPCGTMTAAKRHRAHGEPLCELCREAERQEWRERIARRRRAVDKAVDQSADAVDNHRVLAAVNNDDDPAAEPTDSTPRKVA